MSTMPPIRRQILVDADPATAFDVFTTRLGRWWPLATHSVHGMHGAGGAVAFAGGQLIEQSAAGERVVWGTVTRWEPPAALAFTWHPGYPEDRASQVEVTFSAAGEQTLVTLTHSGWEAFADPAAARANYGQGWPAVLAAYQEHTLRRDDGDEDTWVALLHRPGPAAPPDGAVFDDPMFAEHVAFLNRMQQAGYLVAAGPMTDAAGEGMTILRLPGPDQLAQATLLATTDDTSVAGGFFAVTVRPWQVMMQAEPHASHR
jgi:uncharacterized protein YciI/uncharacterized protein YndB with AHSA1/START domain